MVVLAFAPLSLFNISIFYLLGDSASELSHRTPLGILLNSALPAFGAMQVIAGAGADADADVDAPISKQKSVRMNLHSQSEKGIAMPSGSDKALYRKRGQDCGGIWDCQSAQVGIMLNEGIQHPNHETNLSLSGPVGQVYALVVGKIALCGYTRCAYSLLWDIGGWTVVQPAKIVAAVEQLCQKNICTSGEV
ncbi:pyruvate dehydrogenase E1 beta [Actinidia rufa]|uniref:Pyruvate dehydrogenase E1 beta n=1 Tax=Actinidia rufa TaxID=165716 RepID=A0A7J0GNL2_9ERIC|nr:pyruvate dehydrogenase E1 beta [Actinidia rufa]